MHWIYPSVGGAIFGFGLGSIGDATLTLVIDSYRDVGPSIPYLFGGSFLILHLNRSPVTPSRVLHSFEMPSVLAFRLLLRHGWSEMVCRICSLPVDSLVWVSLRSLYPWCSMASGLVLAWQRATIVSWSSRAPIMAVDGTTCLSSN
jgi:hypothetical protein